MGSSPLKFDEGIYQNVPPSLMAIDLSKAHHFSYLFVKFRGCIPIWGGISLTYPKPNFLTFGQYIHKIVPPKKI